MIKLVTSTMELFKFVLALSQIHSLTSPRIVVPGIIYTLLYSLSSFQILPSAIFSSIKFYELQGVKGIDKTELQNTTHVWRLINIG